MARININEIKKRANEINNGWRQDATAATVKFRNIAQGNYETKINACSAKDQELADAEAVVKRIKNERVDMYRDLNADSVNVREGVEGDPNYGDDSPLYGAMNFKRKSLRASGLTRRKKEDKDEDK